VAGFAARSAGKLVAKDDLIRRIWPGAIVTENRLQVRTMAIRKAPGLPRYAAARDSFEEANKTFDRSLPDGKAAIRSTFAAVETVFRLIVGPKATRLRSREVRQHLQPMVSRVYADVALQSAIKTLNRQCEWIEAARFYRHAQGVEEPVPPPLELAIAIASPGACHLRWLIDLDRATNPASRAASS
jgi:hypothetical protein